MQDESKTKAQLIEELRQLRAEAAALIDNQVKEALAEQQTRHDEAQRIAHLGHWTLDLLKDDLVWSDESYRIFGVEPGTENTYQTFLKTVHPDDYTFVDRAYRESVKNHTPYDIEHRLMMQDGSIKWVNERCKTFYDDDGTPLRSIGTTLDITERKQVENSLLKSRNKYRQLFNGMTNGFAFHKIETDKNGNPVDYTFLDVNPAFEKITTIKAEDVIGKKVTDTLPGIEDDPVDWIRTYGKVALEGKEIRFENYSVVLNKWFSIFAYSPEKGYFATIFEDITERKQAEEKIREIAYHDHLTELPNRALFYDRLEHGLAHAHRNRKLTALLALDLDYFKSINDELGHEWGDQALVEVGKRLLQCVRATDTVARLGGDEFSIILVDVASEEAACKIAEKVIAAIGQPLSLNKSKYTLGVSIGICMASPDDGDMESLMSKADSAMYQAKKDGKHCYRTSEK